MTIKQPFILKLQYQDFTKPAAAVIEVETANEKDRDRAIKLLQELNELAISITIPGGE